MTMSTPAPEAARPRRKPARRGRGPVQASGQAKRAGEVGGHREGGTSLVPAAEYDEGRAGAGHGHEAPGLGSQGGEALGLHEEDAGKEEGADARRHIRSDDRFRLVGRNATQDHPGSLPGTRHVSPSRSSQVIRPGLSGKPIVAGGSVGHLPAGGQAASGSGLFRGRELARRGRKALVGGDGLEVGGKAPAPVPLVRRARHIDPLTRPDRPA